MIVLQSLNLYYFLFIFNAFTLTIGTERSEQNVSDQGLHYLSPIQQFLDNSRGRKMDFFFQIFGHLVSSII